MNKQQVSIIVGSIVGATLINALMFACGATSGQKPIDAALAADTPNNPADPTVAPPGTVVAFAGPNVPAGWLACDGSPVSRSMYGNLFDAIGTHYGEGDQVATFNLPDLRGRVPVGIGQGPGLSNRALAAKGGEERHTLTIAEMPAHSHDERGTMRLDYANGGGIHAQDTSNESFAQFSTGDTGGSQPHNVMPPFVVVQYIIKT